jgi:hypothetical protein
MTETQNLSAAGNDVVAKNVVAKNVVAENSPQIDLNAGPAGLEMVEITWGNTLRIWWSYLWRCTLYTLLFAAIAGLLVGVVMGAMGETTIAGGMEGATFASLLGYILSIPISIAVLKDILEMKYRAFSIALVKAPPQG